MTPLVRKFIGTAGLQLLSKGLIVITGIVFARYLGVEEYGTYSFVLSMVTIATLPVIAGLPNLLVREVANYHLEKKWEHLYGVISWSRAYMAILSVLAIVAISLLLKGNFFDDKVTNLLYFSIWLIPLRGGNVHQGAVINGLRMPILSQIPTHFLAPAVTLLTLFIFIFLDIDLNAFFLVLINLISSLISVLVGFFILSRVLKNNTIKKSSKYKIKKWHLALMPFTMMAFVGTLNIEMASVFVGFMVDHESVAYFKVAIQAVVLISLGLSSINTIIMPNIARYYKQGDLLKTQELLTRSVRLSTMTSLPIIFMLVCFGDYFITNLFGDEFLPAYPILIILCLGQFFNVVMGSVGLVLNMTNNESSTLKILFFVFCANLFLFLILVPIYGVIGAAYSVSISYVLVNVITAMKVKSKTNLITWIR
jgi:O-antigen/teichoic acid export membrane protein